MVVLSLSPPDFSCRVTNFSEMSLKFEQIKVSDLRLGDKVFSATGEKILTVESAIVKFGGGGVTVNFSEVIESTRIYDHSKKVLRQVRETESIDP